MTRKQLGQRSDVTFSWVTEINPELEQWRSLAEEWLKTVKHGKQDSLNAINKFLFNYLHENNISKDPAEFLKKGYSAKSFYDTCLYNLAPKWCGYLIRYVNNFLDWVLKNYFSVEDDYGVKVIPHEYHNPILLELEKVPNAQGRMDESNKNTLPYRFIKQIRTILCPKEANCFKDWQWSQKAMDIKRNGGDWFVVDESIVDKNDPDCVWRKRKSTKKEQENKGLPELVYELWSPVRAVALYVKLLLPLRTYQVRMLDSGETDTYRYEQPKREEAGQWKVNDGALKEGSEKNPFRRGVFRKFTDSVRKIEMTGFYINTNKTADINKSELSKGYEIPWQFEEALYWMVKLRNWQEKYNPIEKPTPWITLDRKHLANIKDQSILKQMGSTCFLFRAAYCEGENKSKPIGHGSLKHLWYKLLLDLQNRCESLGDLKEEKSLKFVKNKQTATYYPLHSLRVSLVTAYALEGGVPMPILSKCIAGHARLIMTLYYTKAGITYVSEKMNEAEQRMAKEEQESYKRWLKDAKYKQLEAYCAVNDPVSIQAVLNAQQSNASFIKDDKGICPKGALGCDTGGVYVNDDTGKTTYGVVHGYPEQNCVRCRWFLTGPAFLPGLVNHFNVIGHNISETAERLISFEQQVEELENMRYECEQNDHPFLDNEKLSKLEKLLQQEFEKNDKLANDYNATLRLIDRCIAIVKDTPQDNGLQFVSVGTMEDAKFAIESADRFSQIQTVCNGATIFPETDASKAVLQRSQILDLTLEMNGQKPVFFKLTPEQQLIAGNAWMQLILKRTGSLKGAVPYVEGRKKLADLGLNNGLNELLEEVTGERLLVSNTDNLKLISTFDKEVTDEK